MKATAKIIRWLKMNRFRLTIVFVCVAIVAVGLMVWADRVCERAASGRIYKLADTVPEREVGLVLGASKQTRHGNANLHFNQRITAAAELYKAGKVHRLLVSGDNHIATYDEPTDMRNALIAAGV